AGGGLKDCRMGSCDRNKRERPYASVSLSSLSMQPKQDDKPADPDALTLRIYERAELCQLFECEDVLELRLLLAWMMIEPFYVPPEYISVTNYQLPQAVRKRAEQLFPR